MTSIRIQLLCLLILVAPISAFAATPAGKDDVLLTTMQKELQRAKTDLAKTDPAPYFLGYQVYDQNMTVAVGSQGSLMNSTHYRQRTGEAIMRVGAPALDNGHLGNRSSA